MKHEVVDVTPTWREILPKLVEQTKSRYVQVARDAWQELYRLADLLDSHNAAVRKQAGKLMKEASRVKRKAPVAKR